MSTQNLTPTPLSAIAGMPDAAPLYLLEARVKKVFERKTGTYKQGARTGESWSLQNVTLTQDGVDVEMVLKDREEEMSKTWQGRKIRVASFKGEKGWSGVYTLDDTYKEKTTRKIKVTPTGDIALLDEHGNAEAQTQRQQDPPRQQPPAQQQAPAKQEPARQQTQQQPPAQTQQENAELDRQPAQRTAEQQEKANRREAQRVAYQMANLQLLALNMTEQYTAKRFHAKTGRGLDAQEKHAWAMNLSIELCRQGMLSRMPCHAVKDDPEPQPSDNDGTA